MSNDATWSVSKSAELYQIRGWGEPYYLAGEGGQVEVRPNPNVDRTINLFELVKDLRGRGLELPLLIRFSDILADRIKRINESFEKAIAEYSYPGVYRGVYPVKVNQQRHLVEEVVEYGRPWQFGLEAGSKPELLIALSAMQDTGGLILCNGYKDYKYIETAVLAQRFGKTVIVTLERIEELDIILKVSEQTGLRPLIGVRAKLTAKGVGRWADSAGERAKFGLTSSEIITVVDRLAERDMLDCLQLLHFHIGSQISSIIPIKNAMQEASQIFVELAKMGAGMKYLDVGGGLAVDYDGSKTDFHASKNYNIEEYANDIVYAIKEACDKAKVACPTIVSESGRAIAAHQSVLLFEVVGTSDVVSIRLGELPPNAHPLIKGLHETYTGIALKNVQEAWHDAVQAKDEAISLFKFGYISLRDRAEVERLFWCCARKVGQQLKRMRFVPEELRDLEKILASIYYCNFSVFQSAPDCWAIDQLFPIMPIHRLDEEPTVRATLADLTCDSDGAINDFIDRDDIKHVLEVHDVKETEPYVMGMFLNGAYQEILGDLHNLFGDTNTVHVRLSESGHHVSHVVKGDSVSEVLHYVQYAPENMVEKVRMQAERALGAGEITIPQMRLLMRNYEEGLANYTYLTVDE
jgi:arginine decarboxylase